MKKYSGKIGLVWAVLVGLGLLGGCSKDEPVGAKATVEVTSEEKTAENTQEKPEEKKETQPVETTTVGPTTEETTAVAKGDLYEKERQEAKEEISKWLENKKVLSLTVGDPLTTTHLMSFRLMSEKTDGTVHYGERLPARGAVAAFAECYSREDGVLASIEGQNAFRLRYNYQSVWDVVASSEEGSLLEGDIEPYTNTQVAMFNIPEEDQVEYFWIVEIPSEEKVTFIFLNKELYTREEAGKLIGLSE